MTVRIEHGDSREVLKTLADYSVDACVTDPPYSLQTINKRFAKVGRNDKTWSKSGPHQRTAAGFMNQKWDTGHTAHDPEFWIEVYRVLKPGAHLVAFGGTRTYHRMVCAIEDAGFDIRDMIVWHYATGFPKSHDVSKGIDKAAGAEREVLRERYTVKRIKPGATVVAEGAWGKQEIPFTATDTAPASEDSAQWQGWGTALKPATEPIVLARKPLSEPTVAANVLKWGTGALNIDGCRIPGTPEATRFDPTKHNHDGWRFDATGADCADRASPLGRWPANLCHDSSDEVLACFPESAGQLMSVGPKNGAKPSINVYGDFGSHGVQHDPRGDTGSAARFFFSAKADKTDRWGSKHPTVKPVDLIRWLIRLVTPPGGTILDPFAGSGTAGVAALAEGVDAILIEREATYHADIVARMSFYAGEGKHSVAAKARSSVPRGTLPLFE